MDKWNRGLQKAVKLLNDIAGWALAACMALVTVTVLLRAAFGWTVLGTYEWVGFLTAICICLGLAYCAIVGGHIAIDFILEKLKPGAKRVVAAVTQLLSSFFMAAVTWNIFIYAGKLAQSGEVSPTTRVPFYLFVYLMGAGFFALVLVLITSFIRTVRGEGK